MSVARYSILRCVTGEGVSGFAARERRRSVDGARVYSAPHGARWVESTTRDNLVDALRAKGASKIQKRKNQWVVIFSGGRRAVEEED